MLTLTLGPTLRDPGIEERCKRSHHVDTLQAFLMFLQSCGSGIYLANV